MGNSTSNESIMTKSVDVISQTRTIFQSTPLFPDTLPTDMDYVASNVTELYLDNNSTFECMNHNEDHKPYLNITCESDIDLSVSLYGYCLPFLLVLTIVLNTLIVIVLSKRNMASPTNSVLRAMAISDMLTLAFPSPLFLYMYTFGNHTKPLTPASVCYIWNLLYEIIPATFHTASIWLTLALAVQRYIYVCHAPVARTWCTMPRVNRCIFYIFICAVLHQLPRLFDRTYELIPIHWNNETTTACHIDEAIWVGEVIGINIYYASFFLFRIFCVHLVPCASLVTLNILLFRAMKIAQDKREKLFRENRKKECKKLRDANCTTLMLIVVVAVFLSVELPLAVLSGLHVLSQMTSHFLDFRLVNRVILVSNFTIIISYPLNFGIYCGMSRQFRENFKSIFMRSIVARTTTETSRYSLVYGPRTCTNETVL